MVEYNAKNQDQLDAVTKQCTRKFPPQENFGMIVTLILYMTVFLIALKYQNSLIN